MILSIVIGLIVWLAVPKLFAGKGRKSQREANAMACKIIGLSIIVWAIVKHIL